MVSFPTVYQRVVLHWRAIILLLILALATFLIVYPDRGSPDFLVVFDLFVIALLLIFIASQFFWIGRILDLGERFIPGKPRRAWLAIIAGLVYLFVLTYSYPEWGLGHTIRAADYRPQSILIDAAFWWWFVGSQMAFLLVIAFGMADRAARAAAWVWGKAREAMQGHGAALRQGAIALDPPSPARRHFLEQTAMLVSATGFVAAGYGLFYGRQDVE